MDDFVKMVEATLKDDRDRFFNFLSLVRRMREAQEALLDTACKTLSETEVCKVRAWALEREVDEYLKRYERI